MQLIGFLTAPRAHICATTWTTWSRARLVRLTTDIVDSEAFLFRAEADWDWMESGCLQRSRATRHTWPSMVQAFLHGALRMPVSDGLR